MTLFRSKDKHERDKVSYVDYGRDVIDAYNGIRSFRHDLSSYFDVMNALAEAERWSELAAYIRELRGEYYALSAVTLSGNVVVDGILSSAMKRAAAVDADMQIHVVLPYKTMLSALDWTILLGNLTTNAIEACNEVKAAGGIPYIKLDISFSYGMLHLEIENASTGRYKPRGSTYASTKENGRGLGLKRAENIVKTHGGYITYEAKCDMFITRVMLPLEA